MPAIPLTLPPRSHLPRFPATAIVLALVASRPLVSHLDCRNVLILIVAGHPDSPFPNRPRTIRSPIEKPRLDGVNNGRSADIPEGSRQVPECEQGRLCQSARELRLRTPGRANEAVPAL